MSGQLGMVSLTVDMRQLHELAARRGWLGGRAIDEGRALHHLLSEAFGPRSLQPFRLMPPVRGRLATLYAYTTAEPETLLETMALAAPDTQAVFAGRRVRHKTMPDRFAPGRRLGFDVRIRPVRRSRALCARGGQGAREIDAFLFEALQHPDDGDWMRRHGRTREAVYADWLAERLQGAARLEPGVRLVRFRRLVSSRGQARVEGPDAVMHGVLQVEDTDAFADLLRRGIGRHRAYGYGMLLLRPAPAAQPGG